MRHKHILKTVTQVHQVAPSSVFRTNNRRGKQTQSGRNRHYGGARRSNFRYATCDPHFSVATSLMAEKTNVGVAVFVADITSMCHNNVWSRV